MKRARQLSAKRPAQRFVIMCVIGFTQEQHHSRSPVMITRHFGVEAQDLRSAADKGCAVWHTPRIRRKNWRHRFLKAILHLSANRP